MTGDIPTDLTADRLTALIASWRLVLRAERKSPQTITTYLDGLHRYLTWCTARDVEPMNRTCAALQRTELYEPLHHRRDEAIVRLMLETGVRVGEVVALEIGDLDLVNGLVHVRRGKGGNGRVVPIGPAAVAALRRYLDLRERHRDAHEADLWLGERGRGFGYDGLSRALRRRVQRAGTEGFHPHRLRHTAAHRWLAHGGSESGLMAMAGWTRTDMLVRYTKARAMERVALEARRLNLCSL